jgi:uncharacterized RDD family membrane protein YckC
VNNLPESPYANFWERLFSRVIDEFILAIPMLILVAILNQSSVNKVAALLAQIFVPFPYVVIMDSSKYQGTIGKIFLKIRVTDLGGNRLSFKRATGRYLGRLVVLLTGGLGYLMVAFSEKKQGLHDEIADCLVLKGRPDVAS